MPGVRTGRYQMAMAYFHEWPGVTREMAQGVQGRIYAELGNAAPDGGIFAADGETDGAYWTFDVWESGDAALRFYHEIRDPALQAEGIPQSKPRVLPIHWHSMQPPAAEG